MDDAKRASKFEGRLSENCNLWCARTEAACAAKEVLCFVEGEFLSTKPLLSDTDKKMIATTSAIIIQGLRDRPLRLCLSTREDLYKMWNCLKDRYTVSNTATMVPLQIRLLQMRYKNKPREEYIDRFKEFFNLLGSMERTMAQDLQMAKLVASYGDQNRSPHSLAIASLQIMQDGLD